MVGNFVGGRWLPADRQPEPIRNPADTSQVVGWVQTADDSVARAAIAAAHDAVRPWNAVSIDERIALLRRGLELLSEQTDAFAENITLENGKTLVEARTEVSATGRDARYQLDVIGNAALEISAPPQVDARSRTLIHRQPLGTLVLITPWNFPLATIARKLIPALALGNTAVVKPSGLTPLTAVRLFQVLDECGLPAGVANLVVGAGATVGDALVDDPRLDGISFTGSTEVGQQLARRVASRDVRVQAEMGGKNALVVLADADVGAAMDAAVTASFGCAGQWCLSTSRVIVERPIYEDFVQELGRRASQLRLGAGTNDKTQMGPLISSDQVARVASAAAQGIDEGARLVTGGAAVAVVDGATGHYFQPTVFADVTPDHRLAQEEIFGPVVSVLVADSPDDALRLVASTRYGLAFSVYTNDDGLADRFMRDVDAGICHVNLPTYYREAHMPVAGWGDSGRGAPECGDFAVEAFTRVKAVYRR